MGVVAIIVLINFGFHLSVYGRVGETVQQCKERYGEIKVSSIKEEKYESIYESHVGINDRILVRMFFNKSICRKIVYECVYGTESIGDYFEMKITDWEKIVQENLKDSNLKFKDPELIKQSSAPLEVALKLDGDFMSYPLIKVHNNTFKKTEIPPGLQKQIEEIEARLGKNGQNLIEELLKEKNEITADLKIYGKRNPYKSFGPPYRGVLEIKSSDTGQDENKNYKPIDSDTFKNDKLRGI